MLRFDPALRIDIPPDLLDALRALSAKRRPYPPITDHHPGVVITTGLGDAWVLTFDGDLVVHPYLDDLDAEVPIRAALHLGEVIRALRLGAERLDAALFGALIPTRPAAMPDCAACAGLGWVRMPPFERFVCPTCHGLGWPHPRLTTE